MDKNFIKGILLTLGILSLFGLVFAVGFHTADEILSGEFTGDYNFSGNLDFTAANIAGGGTDSILTDFPDVIICNDGSKDRYLYIVNSDSSITYRFPSSASSIDVVFNSDGNYNSNTNAGSYDCISKSISTLYSEGKAVNLLSGLGSVPAGAVMSFYLSSCPTGWKACDGTDGTPDLRGQFVRGLNDFGTGVRSDGNEDPDGRSLGDSQNDAFQGHWHDISNGAYGLEEVTRATGGSYGARYSVTHSYKATDLESDGVNGEPRVANETRPNNVALIYCQKE